MNTHPSPPQGRELSMLLLLGRIWLIKLIRLIRLIWPIGLIRLICLIRLPTAPPKATNGAAICGFWQAERRHPATPWRTAHYKTGRETAHTLQKLPKRAVFVLKSNRNGLLWLKTVILQYKNIILYAFDVP